LLAFGNALLLALPLLALLATGTVIGRARDDGSLELLLSHPIRRTSYFVALSLVRAAMLYAPLAVMTVAAALYARLALGAPVPWPFVGRTLAVAAALVAAFVGVGLAVSTFVRQPGKAVVTLLLIWALGAALLDLGLIGLLLRVRLPAPVVF